DGIRDFHVTGVQTCALPICTGREIRGERGRADEVGLGRRGRGRERGPVKAEIAGDALGAGVGNGDVKPLPRREGVRAAGRDGGGDRRGTVVERELSADHAEEKTAGGRAVVRENRLLLGGAGDADERLVGERAVGALQRGLRHGRGGGQTAADRRSAGGGVAGAVAGGEHV